jgi:GT2 family glycosyltransferase
MTIRREVFERLGFFDERFGAGSSIPVGEDTDYVYRAYQEGIIVEYVADMKVFHFHGRRTTKQGHMLFQNYMIARGGLYAKYFFKDYNLCRHFYWDLKAACKELFQGGNNFLRKLIFHTEKLFCVALQGRPSLFG